MKEESSWRESSWRDHEGGIIKGESSRRNHHGGIIWGLSGGSLGAWLAMGRPRGNLISKVAFVIGNYRSK